MTPTYVTIPTRNRHAMVKGCIDSIIDSDCIECIIIVDNNSEPPIEHSNDNVFVTHCHDDPPNISRLWNRGIDAARALAQFDGHQEFNIAVINSDVVCPPGWLEGIGEGLRKYNAALAYPDQHDAAPGPIKHVYPGPVDLRTRITGFAFMLRGETSIRLNEELVWWYGDDDLDWRCREIGGSVLLPGLAVKHLDPNGSMNARPELSAQAGRDRTTFQRIWGTTPW